MLTGKEQLEGEQNLDKRVQKYTDETRIENIEKQLICSWYIYAFGWD